MSESKSSRRAAASEVAISQPKPAMIRLTHPHSFIEDDAGRHRMWKAGDVVKDQAEIELLIERGARVEFLD